MNPSRHTAAPGSVRQHSAPSRVATRRFASSTHSNQPRPATPRIVARRYSPLRTAAHRIVCNPIPTAPLYPAAHRAFSQRHARQHRARLCNATSTIRPIPIAAPRAASWRFAAPRPAQPRTAPQRGASQRNVDLHPIPVASRRSASPCAASHCASALRHSPLGSASQRLPTTPFLPPRLATLRRASCLSAPRCTARQRSASHRLPLPPFPRADRAVPLRGAAHRITALHGASQRIATSPPGDRPMKT